MFRKIRLEIAGLQMHAATSTVWNVMGSNVYTYHVKSPYKKMSKMNTPKQSPSEKSSSTDGSFDTDDQSIPTCVASRRVMI